MTNKRDKGATVLERERILAEAVQPVAAELRLVDLAILAEAIQGQKHGNLDDLVASSTELFFKPGTLKYGLRADVDMRWGSAPTVSIDLEFCHQDVTVFFALGLGAVAASVDIHVITFEGTSRSPGENTRRFIGALADARTARTETTALPRLS